MELDRGQDEHFAQLFVDTGDEFREEDSLKKSIAPGERELVFDLSHYPAIYSLRFDPANDFCLVQSLEIIYYDSARKSVNVFGFVDSEKLSKWNITFFTDDPIIELPLPDGFSPSELVVYIHYLLIGEKAILPVLRNAGTAFIELQSKNTGMEHRMNDYKQNLHRVQSELKQHIELLESKEEQLLRKNSEIVSLDSALAEERGKVQEALDTINNMRHSIGQLETDQSILRTQLAVTEKTALDLQGLLAEEQNQKQLLSERNESHRSHIQGLEAHISLLREEVVQKAVYIAELRSSFSYRAGRFLTFPFRWMSDRFLVPLLIWRLVVLLLSNPRHLGLIFDKRNYRTLIRAIRREHPSQILDNLRRKTGYRPTLVPIEEDQRDGILFHVDYAIVYSGTAQVKGWALSRSGIESVSFHANDGWRKTDYGTKRLDVYNAYIDYPDSIQSGFVIETRLSAPTEGIEIKIVDQSGASSIHLVKLNPSFEHLSDQDRYHLFRERNKLSDSEINKIEKEIASFIYLPKISIVVPIHNVAPRLLKETIKSVKAQHYPHWELCLYDDASSNEDTIAFLQESAQSGNERIKVGFGEVNLHISGATNQAIGMASGDFIGLLDHDDCLHALALYEVVKALNEDVTLDFIYSDEDKIDLNGKFVEPYFKSDFNPDLLLSNNYICHFSVIRKTLGDELEWFRAGFEGSQDYDLFLRIISHSRKIRHIPKVLYHWRKVGGSTADSYDSKEYVDKGSIRALSEYMKANGMTGHVELGLEPSTFRVVRKINEQKLVSIIIPFRDKVDLLRKCLKSIQTQTLYKEIEILLVDNGSQKQETHNYLKKVQSENHRIRVLNYPGKFNFSAINNWAAGQTQGEYLLFLNNDTEILQEGWLCAMAEHIQRKGIGAVGAKLLYPDNTIQHAGVIIGIQGVAGHAFKYFKDSNPGYYCRASVIQNLSACTAACLLVKKRVYETVEGMDERNFTIAFNDIDLCLKIREAGYRIVYTPFAKLYHYESKSRGYEDTAEKQDRFLKEIQYFQTKWRHVLRDGDPYYNPNLTLEHEDFRIKIPE